MAQLLGFRHCNLVKTHIDHKNRVWQRDHVLDAANIFLQLRQLTREHELLLFAHAVQTTFELNSNLRPFLRGDVWPHAGRKSFVDLLKDKEVKADSGSLEIAVGLRLTFRQPPPIACFSNNFLLYLNGTVASTAYGTWASMISRGRASITG